MMIDAVNNNGAGADTPPVVSRDIGGVLFGQATKRVPHRYRAKITPLIRCWILYLDAHGADAKTISAISGVSVRNVSHTLSVYDAKRWEQEQGGMVRGRYGNTAAALAGVAEYVKIYEFGSTQFVQGTITWPAVATLWPMLYAAEREVILQSIDLLQAAQSMGRIAGLDEAGRLAVSGYVGRLTDMSISRQVSGRALDADQLAALASMQADLDYCQTAPATDARRQSIMAGLPAGLAAVGAAHRYDRRGASGRGAGRE